MASPEQKREKLTAAVDYVGAQRRSGAKPEAILAGLVDQHAADLRPRWDVNRLSCAGVTSTCTYSAAGPLLDNWCKTAALRLIQSKPEPSW